MYSRIILKVERYERTLCLSNFLLFIAALRLVLHFGDPYLIPIFEFVLFMYSAVECEHGLFLYV